MKRNRFAAWLLVGVMIAGAVLLTVHRNPIAKPQLPQLAASVTGPGTMEPAPNAYLTICLPANWQTDTLSQQLLSETAQPNFQKLRQVAATKIYVKGNPDFDHRFQSDCNGGPVKTLPAVVIHTPDGADQKWSGDNVMLAENQLDGCLRKILHCPLCPKPEPKPEPQPVSPARPELPDSPNVDPAVVEDVNKPAVVIACLLVGGCVWGVMFRNRPS